MNKKAVIMFSEDAFHLGYMGATQRIIHIANAFRSLKYEVVLVCGRYTNYDKQSEIDDKFNGTVIRTSHSGNYPQLIETSAFTKRIWRLVWKNIGEEYYWKNIHCGWAHKLNMDLLKTQIEELNIVPTLTWGITTGYLSGALAANEFAKILNIPFIFEIHDPPRYGHLGKKYKHIHNKYFYLLKNAKNIVVTSNSYGVKINENFSISEKKINAIHLSHNGIKKVVHNKNKFIISYVGSLNGGRSLSFLPIVIKEIIRLEPEISENLEFVLAGYGSGYNELHKLSKKYGVEEWINYRGVVDVSEASFITNISEVSILVQPENCVYQIPGKLFELMASGKPVISLMPNSFEAAKIIRKSGIGIVASTDDVEKISNVIIKLWKGWLNKKYILQPNNEYIEKYSVKNLPHKIYELII